MDLFILICHAVQHAHQKGTILRDLKPGTKLSGSDTLQSVAANRQIEPAKLSALVRGELDGIVMKALEKDRARRYETANGLADVIQRYLDIEPSRDSRVREVLDRAA